MSKGEHVGKGPGVSICTRPDHLHVFCFKSLHMHPVIIFHLRRVWLCIVINLAVHCNFLVVACISKKCNVNAFKSAMS